MTFKVVKDHRYKTVTEATTGELNIETVKSELFWGLVLRVELWDGRLNLALSRLCTIIYFFNHVPMLHFNIIFKN